MIAAPRLTHRPPEDSHANMSAIGGSGHGADIPEINANNPECPSLPGFPAVHRSLAPCLSLRSEPGNFASSGSTWVRLAGVAHAGHNAGLPQRVGMPQCLRIFISSPGDVPDERLRADLIVEKLSQDYSRFFTIESYRWEHEAMLASAHFQDAIELPSAFDIVVLILWSRLGTPLPKRTAMREYRGIDGRAPVTGTEWEYEEALAVAREKKAPDLLAFRNISPTPIDPRDPKARATANAQLDALDEFWRRHFADKGVFLAAYDEYRTLEDFARRLEESLRKLIERRIKDAAAGGVSREPIWLGDPFRGLESYEFEHAPIFFGRDAAIAKATEQLAANARAGRAFLLVSGASGSGKSSLVKAGVVPRLMKPQRISRAAFLRRAVFRPGNDDSDVFLGLANSLTRANAQNLGLPELMAPGQDETQLASYLRGGVGDAGYLFANTMGRVTESGRKAGLILGFEEAKLILVVDQLEELFTAPGVGPQERRRFIQLLDGLARSGAVWVIATLRADFWHRAAEISELIGLAEGSGRIDLAAPSAGELAQMIGKPTQAAGMSFEPDPQSGLGLDAVLAEHAAAAPGALPLLSFTLDELYRSAKTRDETALTHASYEMLGGLEGAIAKRADEVMATLPAAAQAALPRVLRALTTIAGAAEQVSVSRSAPLGSFPPGNPARTLIDALIAARLLVAADESGVGATVRLAHEALISRWRWARDQVAIDRRDLETRTLVERQLKRWSDASGRERSLLFLRNPDLANAMDLARRWGDELGADQSSFINESEAAAKATTRRRWVVAATVMICLACLTAASVGALYVAEHQRNDALIAQSKFLARDSRTATASGNPTRGILLALAALPENVGLPSRPFVESAEEALEFAISMERERTVLIGHTDAVLQAAFSPDGHRIVTGSDDNTARVWDARSGALIWTLQGHQARVIRVSFSSDGTRLLTASSDGTARLWDATTGRLVKLLRMVDPGVPPSSIRDAAFSPDGARIVTASGFGHDPWVWDSKTGEKVSILHGHVFNVNCVAFSPDSSLVVTGSNDSTTRVWDAVSGHMIAVAHNFANVSTVAFSPDGTKIAAGLWNNVVHIWDWKTDKKGETVVSLKGHDAPIHSIEFSPDGQKLVTSSGDGTARIWALQTGSDPTAGAQWNLSAVLKGHQGSVNSAVFSPNGQFVLTSSSDGTARIWSAYGGASVYIFADHDAAVTSAVYSPDGRTVLTASSDHTARIWDIESATHDSIIGRNAAADEELESTITAAEFSPDGKAVLTASLDGHFALWNANSGLKLSSNPSGPSREISVSALSPDGKTIVTGSSDSRVRLWRVNGGLVTQWTGHDGQINSVAFSPDGNEIVTASDDKTARVWKLNPSGDPIVLRGHAGWVRSAAFSSDGARILTVSSDNTARVWRAQTGDLLITIKSDAGSINGAAFSPDGTAVATWSSTGTAYLWSSDTGKELMVLQGHAEAIDAASFSPDGAQIATGSDDNTVKIWDVRSGRTRFTLTGHQGGILALAYSRDGTKLLTGSRDKTARIWDTKNGALLITLAGHTDRVVSTRFSPDDSEVLTVSADNSARLWKAATGSPIVVLRNRFYGGASNTHVAPNEKWLAVWSDKDEIVRIWNRLSGKMTARLSGHEGKVTSLDISPDSRMLLTTSADKTARIWDSQSGRLIAVLRGHEGAIQSGRFSKDGGRVVTASLDGTARLWDAASGAEIAVLSGHVGPVNAAIFSPDGQLIVTASQDGTARIWDAKTGLAKAILNGHKDAVISVQFSPEGRRILTASWDGSARLWDAVTGKLAQEFREGEGDFSAWRTRLSPDGSRVLTVYNDRYLWNTDTGALVKKIEGNGLVVFSKDGSRLAAQSSKPDIVTIFDSKTGHPIQSFPVLSSDSSSDSDIAFSHDGRRIVTTPEDYSEESEAEVYSVDSGVVITKLASRIHSMETPIFSSNDSEVWTPSSDGTVTIWMTPHCDNAMEFARRILPRQFTDAEQSEYFLRTKASGLLIGAYNKIRPGIAWLFPQSGDTCR